MCKGSSGSGSTQTATSSTAPPQAVQDAYKNITSLAEQAASAPLQQYSGPLLAGFTDQQNQGFQGINNAQNTLQPYLNSASGLVNQGTQNIYSQLPQFNQQNVQQYENPYNQDVIQATLAQINQQNQQQQQQLTGNAIAQGAWGGDRAAVAQGVLGGQQAMATNSTLAGLNSQNYQQALGEFNNQQATQLSALQNQAGLDLQGAGLQGYLGNAALTGQLGVANAQLQAGNQQQAQAQNALNIPYQQFLQQQAYPFQTTQFLANTLLGTAGTQGGTSTNTQPSQTGNTGAQIAGLGLGVAGLFSDRRVKDDIKRVGKTDDGLPIYTFKYKGDDTTHMGLMAQDVEKKRPDAVGEVDGIKTVNYDKATRKGLAGGGGVPDVNVNFIPLDPMSAGGIGLPAVPKIEQPKQDDGLADIMAGASLGKGAFSGSLGNWLNGAGGIQAMTLPAAGGTFEAGSNGIGVDNFSGSGLFGGGGNGYLGAGGNFADGGATVNVPKDVNAPTTTFIDLGGATGKVPTYSFGVPGGTSNNNGYSSAIPSTLDYSKLKNFSLSPLLTPNLQVNGGASTSAPAAAPATSGITPEQLTGVMNEYSLLGNDSAAGDRARMALNDPTNAVQNYLSTGNWKYAKGGGIKGYATRGGIPGIPESFIGGTNDQSGDNSDDTSQDDPTNIMSGIVPNVPNFGLSASPLYAVNKAQKQAGLSAAAAPQLAQSITAPVSDATETDAAPSAGLALGKVDPGLALSEAGFAMAAAPGHSFLQNAAIGAQAGLKNYTAQKAAQVTADEKAEQLATLAERFGTGNWSPITLADGSTGLLNTKTGETKQADQNFTPVGKGNSASVDKAPPTKQFPDGTMRQWNGTSWVTANTGAVTDASSADATNPDFGWEDQEKKNAANLSPKQILQNQKTNDKVQEIHDKNSQITDNQMRTLDNLKSLATSAPAGGLAPYEIGAMNVLSPSGSTATQGKNFNQQSSALVLGDTGYNYVPGMRGSDMITKLRLAAKPDISMSVPSKLSAIADLQSKYMDGQISSDIDAQYRAANNVSHLSSPVVDQIDRTLKSKYPISSMDADKNIVYNPDNVAKIQALIPLAIQNGPDVLKNPDKYLQQASGTTAPDQAPAATAPAQQMVSVISPTGKSGKIPAENLEKALAAGYKRAQ